jgi:hypothetical protein
MFVHRFFRLVEGSMEIDRINIFLFTVIGILVLMLIGQYSHNSYRKIRSGAGETDIGSVEMQPVSRTLASEQLDGPFLTNLQGHA